MQNVTVQFQKYQPSQGHHSTVAVFLLSDHHTTKIIVQHRLKRQETPPDPVPTETVSYSFTRDPTKTAVYGTYSVPKVELFWSSAV